MRIGFLITRMDLLGGAQVHVRDLSLWLKSQGHDPIILGGWPGRVSDHLEHMGLDIIKLDELIRPIHPLKDIRAVLELRQVLKSLKLDLLSCHSSKAGIIGRMAGIGLKTPILYTAHGWPFTNGVQEPNRSLYEILERIAAPLTPKIITVCEADRKIAIKKGIARAGKMTTIHNGMPNLPAVTGDLDNKMEGDPVRLLMIARFGPQKDHESLVKALAKLDPSLNWKCDLIGGGDSSSIIPLIDHHDLTDKVHFLGEQQDVLPYLQAADIYCLISHYEGFPRSILEAMRSALPVIATDVAGVKEAVSHQITGYLVPHQDIETLSQKLNLLIRDNDKRIKMGMAGRRRFEAAYTLDHMAIKTLRLYENILSS